MIFFTADLHLGHDNIRKYTNRPFSTVEEMDAKLIENWNRVVKPKDTVYILGDFAYRNSTHGLAWYRWQLHGEAILVVGNHDDLRAIRRAGEEWVQQGALRVPRPLFKEIHPGLTTFRQGDIFIVLSHYAMRSWDRSHFNSWHLFGHTHGRLPPYGKSFDVGVDCQNFTPLSLDEVIEKMAALPDNPGKVEPREKP